MQDSAVPREVLLPSVLQKQHFCLLVGNSVRAGSRVSHLLVVGQSSSKYFGQCFEEIAVYVSKGLQHATVAFEEEGGSEFLGSSSSKAPSGSITLAWILVHAQGQRTYRRYLKTATDINCRPIFCSAVVLFSRMFSLIATFVWLKSWCTPTFCRIFVENVRLVVEHSRTRIRTGNGATGVHHIAKPRCGQRCASPKIWVSRTRDRNQLLKTDVVKTVLGHNHLHILSQRGARIKGSRGRGPRLRVGSCKLINYQV